MASELRHGGFTASIYKKDTQVDITERQESVRSIEEMDTNGWGISGITGIGKEFTVITGEASEFQSHITVIDRIGGKFKQNVLKSTSLYGYRYCDFLPDYRIATVCESTEIGVYDVRDGAYETTDIEDVIDHWPEEQTVCCVAVDRATRRIIVGGDGSRDVYVFSVALEYMHKIALPEEIEYPYDMVVNAGNLIVCDNGGRAFAVAMTDGAACKLAHELPKPDLEGLDWEPRSVCTDRNGLVYVLWRGELSQQEGEIPQERSILAQYTRDGRRLLQTRVVDSEEGTRCITTVQTGRGEKILIATWQGGKLITYGLNAGGDNTIDENSFLGVTNNSHIPIL